MAGKKHSDIGAALVAALYSFVKANKLGKVYQDNTTYVLEGSPGNIITMRIPDVSFVSSERVDTDDPGYYYLAPDLAIEIISPSERPATTQSKITDYLKHGTKQIWVVDTEAQQVTVHVSEKESTIYGIDDTLSGGEVLPDFELPVSSIFE